MESVYRVFDTVLSSENRVFVAYSGGKDSTCLSILLYDWLVEHGYSDKEVVLVNSDTLSEIPVMREWTVSFMEKYVDKLRKRGFDAKYRIFYPKPTDTFYWRVLIKGYPAPTYCFRWCVNLLKRKPSREIVESTNSILLLGHRDEESSSRKRSLNMKLGSCPLKPGGCASYYLQVEGSVRRAYPMRMLREKEVWDYLESRRREFELDKLFELYLYGSVKARYGCWHCTLVKKQLPHYFLGREYLYLEVGRLVYKWLSNNPKLRAIKNRGYSRYGYLLPEARSVMLHMFSAIEKLSGLKLYGLDESRINGYTLRQIFYELDAKEADGLIRRIEGSDNERIPRTISEIRSLSREINRMIQSIKANIEKWGLNEEVMEVLSEARESI
ncbi:MAG: phosphoadenosine phosphosulfate reductase family protein [Desulfurococcaceae archaeon]